MHTKKGKTMRMREAAAFNRVKVSLEHSTNVEEYCWAQIFTSEFVKQTK